MIKKFLFVMFFCALSVFTLYAQTNISLSGKVVDQSNTPIIDASILIDGLLQTYSGKDGSFEIQLLEGRYKLSIIGYGYDVFHADINIRKNTKQTFTLNSKEVNLKAVEITGKTKEQQLREGALSTNALNVKSKFNELNELSFLVGRSTGTNIRAQGGTGSDFVLSINGLSGNAIRNFVDGVPMSTMGNAVSLGNFPVNLVERIEVYKGVVPSTLGGDALGGAINIIMKKNIRNYLDASYSFGSFNTHISNINAQYTDSKTGLIVRPSFNFNYSKNNYKMKGVQVPEYYVDEDGFERSRFVYINAKRFHDNYLSMLGRLEFGVENKKWADSFFVTTSYSMEDKDLQTGSVQQKVYGKAKRENDSFSILGNYKKRNFIVENLNADISISHTWDHSIVIDTTFRQYRWDGTYIVGSRNELNGGPKSKRHVKRPLTVGRMNLNYILSDVHSLNFNYLIERTENERYDDLDTEFVPSNDILTKQFIGLTYSQSFWNDRLQNLAFIKDYVNHLKIGQKDFSYITGVNDVPKSVTKNYMGYGIASRFRLTNYLAIKGSFEHAIRLPTTRELLGNATTIYPNFKLKPEHSNNVNLGLMGNIDLGGDHGLSYESSVFLRKVEDYIRFNSANITGDSQYENVGKVTVKGVEGELRYNYKDLLHVIANCSYVNEKNKTKYQTNGKPSITYNNLIPNNPWLYSNLEMYVQKKNILDQRGNELKLSYYFQYVHWYYYTWQNIGGNNTKEVIPTQCIHDASLTYSLQNGKYNISLGCNNLFNRLAYDNLKLQKPGRSIFCKLRLFIN